MARLVLGTDKSVRIPAIVKEVPTAMPLSIQKVKDANGIVQNGSTVIDLDGATDVGNYALYYAYHRNTNITGALDLSSLTTVSGMNGCNYMFTSCTGITSVDLSNLTTVSAGYGCGYMFQYCTGITGAVDLSSLTTVSGMNGCSTMFGGCTGITSVDLSSLTTITASSGCGYMFGDCTNLTSVDLSSLATINNMYGCSQMFKKTSLTSLSFPALTSTSFGGYYTNQFNNMLSGVTGCTVHFPSNLQSVIGSWSDVTAGFGGTNTTVLFDLPATN